MNGILLLNGLLFVFALGLQQWLGAHNQLEPFAPWTGFGLLCAGISLIIPLALFVKSTVRKVSRKKEIVALLLFNPLMFSLVPFRYQQLNYSWSLSKIAGPQLIAKYDTDEPIWIGGFFPILEVPNAVGQLYHRYIAKDERS